MYVEVSLDVKVHRNTNGIIVYEEVEVSMWKYLCGSIYAEVSIWKYLCGSIHVKVSMWKYPCGNTHMEVSMWK